MESLTIIGCMSGTSLDGLDFCAAQFQYKENRYQYEILATETIEYPFSLKEQLDSAFHLKEPELGLLNKSYGRFIGEALNDFMMNQKMEGTIDYIGSHGHTVFHEPQKGVTVQIGGGQEIADSTGLQVVNDFRIKDVKLGGQGAPLVPIGDMHLFYEYEACLNLGGISNISFDHKGQRIAFDIGPANMPLNYLMRTHFNLEYDKNGDRARKGKVNQHLLGELNALAFYQIEPPKSLGREWFENEFKSVVNKYNELSIEDQLITIVEHETKVIADIFSKYKLKTCLVTGGGVYNTIFMDSLKEKTRTKVVIPSNQLIEFKEALIFAFLTYLKVNNQINTLSSVTGASGDSIGGIAFTPQ